MKKYPHHPAYWSKQQVIEYYAQFEGTKPSTIEYIKKYWLNEEEYQERWKPIQDKIFDPKANDLPDMMFLPDFELIPFGGGLTFAEEDFLTIQACMQSLGETDFVIIDNYPKPSGINYKPEEQHVFNVKYPVNITWEELKSGGVFSAFVIDGMGPQAYFVFGSSGIWGKYAANDNELSMLDILGFKPAYTNLFLGQFKELLKLDEEEKELIWRYLPPLYKPYYKYFQ